MLFKSSKQFIQRSLFIIVLAGLSACGSRAPKLEPPRVKLVTLIVRDQSDFDLDLRLSNPAARQMTVDRLSLTVRIDGEALPLLEPDFSGSLPALGEELLSTSGSLSEALADTLRPLTEGTRSQLRVEITGEVFHSGGERFEVDESSWLSPTPGRPWQFR